MKEDSRKKLAPGLKVVLMRGRRPDLLNDTQGFASGTGKVLEKVF